MNPLPIKELQEVYEMIPQEAHEIKMRMTVLRSQLETCQAQYEQEQRSPPWLQLFKDTVEYWAIAQLTQAYIIRSAASGASSILTSSIQSAIKVQELLRDAVKNKVSASPQWRNKHFNTAFDVGTCKVTKPKHNNK